jgi:hypothetical protein
MKKCFFVFVLCCIFAITGITTVASASDFTLKDPTAESASEDRCLSFAGLVQWYGTSGTWSEKEASFMNAFNSNLRHYPNLQTLFEAVAPGTSGKEIVSFKAQSYADFSSAIDAQTAELASVAHNLENSILPVVLRSKGIQRIYYNVEKGELSLFNTTNGFRNEGYDIPLNKRVVGEFSFDLDGDKKVDETVFALLEDMDILITPELDLLKGFVPESNQAKTDITGVIMFGFFTLFLLLVRFIF